MRDIAAKTKSFVSSFAKDESGSHVIEVAIWVALLSVAVIVTIQAVTTQVNTTFTAISDTLAAANTP